MVMTDDHMHKCALAGRKEGMLSPKKFKLGALRLL